MLSFRSASAVTAEVFESQGNGFEPDIHIVVSTADEADSEWTQTILDKYAGAVIAYYVQPVFDQNTFSIELQFASTSEGRETARRCLSEYKSGFRRGGFVPKKKQQANINVLTGRRRRLLTNRMYRLENGLYFWYFAKWDRHGNLCGKVDACCPRGEDGHISLENKVVHRSELERAVLIPRGEEPWLPG